MIIHIAYSALFTETEISHKKIFYDVEEGPQRFQRAKDETKLYKNFMQARWLKGGKIRSEFIPMPELCTRLANMSRTNVLLMQVATN